MVQDLCFFLQKLGVGIEGIGTTTLRITGAPVIHCDVEYAPSEDPIEAMSLIAAAIVTSRASRCAGCRSSSWRSSRAAGGDGLPVRPHPRVPRGERRDPPRRHHDLRVVVARPDRQDPPMPFPGLNIDNLPFFAVIAATAEGQTMLHDWVYENRAIYLTEAEQLGARVRPRSAPCAGRRSHPLEWRRLDLPAGASSRCRDPAGDARRQGHLGAPQRLRHQPRVRRPR
ncbi:hypothetical protein [Aeromicrobium sp. UC242_57]|uniref:hypothetical protein n=1 Tax=Aeromicrobium sp. UC242_57 TaxID=3374624 RepID=UPI0037A01ECD